jgi:hypothetical protein
MTTIATQSERQALVRRLQEGKRRKRRERPRRLAAVERRMDALGVEYRKAEPERRREIRTELRALGEERHDLRWGR